VKNRKQVQILETGRTPISYRPLFFEMPSTRREWPERFEYQWLFVYEPSMLNKVSPRERPHLMLRFGANPAARARPQEPHEIKIGRRSLHMPGSGRPLERWPLMRRSARNKILRPGLRQAPNACGLPSSAGIRQLDSLVADLRKLHNLGKNR
jgi:hypothetical protein